MPCNSYWGLGCPSESGESRQVSLLTLVRLQVTRFMESTNLPAVQVTPSMTFGVRGGDDTLKRRVAAKFAEGDVREAVRELASTAPQDGDTLRALKEKHSSAPENLSIPNLPDGSAVQAVAREDDRNRIISFDAEASGLSDGLRPGHLRSLVAYGSADAGSRFLSALTDLVKVKLRGEVPQFALLILYKGANECGIKKMVTSGQMLLEAQ